MPGKKIIVRSVRIIRLFCIGYGNGLNYGNCFRGIIRFSVFVFGIFSSHNKSSFRLDAHFLLYPSVEPPANARHRHTIAHNVCHVCVLAHPADIPLHSNKRLTTSKVSPSVINRINVSITILSKYNPKQIEKKY